MLALTQQQKNDVEITEGCIKDVEREWLVCPTGKGFSNIVSVATKGKNVNSTFELDGTINSEVYKSENLRRELMNVRAFTDTDNQLSFAFEDTMKNEDEYFRCVIRNFDNFLREKRDKSTLKNLIFVLTKIFNGERSGDIIKIDPNEIVCDGKGFGWYATNQKAFEGLFPIVEFLSNIKVEFSYILWDASKEGKDGKKKYLKCSVETSLIRSILKAEEVEAPSLDEAKKKKSSQNAKKYLSFRIERDFPWKSFFEQFERIPMDLLSLCNDTETHLLIEIVRDIRINVNKAKSEHGKKVLTRNAKVSTITDRINIASPEYRETFQGKKNVSRYTKEVIETIEGLNEKCKKVGYPLFVYLDEKYLLKESGEGEEASIPNVSSKDFYENAILHYEASGRALDNSMEMKKRQRAHKQEAKRKAIARNKAKDGNKS